MSKSNLTRRDFLKLSGYGLMGMLLPDLSSYFPQQDDFENLQARVIDRILWAYDEPDPESEARQTILARPDPPHYQHNHQRR